MPVNPLDKIVKPAKYVLTCINPNAGSTGIESIDITVDAGKQQCATTITGPFTDSTGLETDVVDLIGDSDQLLDFCSPFEYTDQAVEQPLWTYQVLVGQVVTLHYLLLIDQKKYCYPLAPLIPNPELLPFTMDTLFGTTATSLDLKDCFYFIFKFLNCVTYPGYAEPLASGWLKFYELFADATFLDTDLDPDQAMCNRHSLEMIVGYISSHLGEVTKHHDKLKAECDHLHEYLDSCVAVADQKIKDLPLSLDEKFNKCLSLLSTATVVIIDNLEKKLCSDTDKLKGCCYEQQTELDSHSQLKKIELDDHVVVALVDFECKVDELCDKVNKKIDETHCELAKMKSEFEKLLTDKCAELDVKKEEIVEDLYKLLPGISNQVKNCVFDYLLKECRDRLEAAMPDIVSEFKLRAQVYLAEGLSPVIKQKVEEFHEKLADFECSLHEKEKRCVEAVDKCQKVVSNLACLEQKVESLGVSLQEQGYFKELITIKSEIKNLKTLVNKLVSAGDF